MVWRVFISRSSRGKHSEYVNCKIHEIVTYFVEKMWYTIPINAFLEQHFSKAPTVAETGVYRFRRGYGGETSGRMRLTSIKRAIYKLNNNNTVAIAA